MSSLEESPLKKHKKSYWSQTFERQCMSTVSSKGIWFLLICSHASENFPIKIISLIPADCEKSLDMEVSWF